MASIQRRINKISGNLCEISATSFFPAKPLGCYGDGGALLTDNDELANILKSIRVHDNFRYKGNGIKIIKHLINEAKNLNILRISIETGSGEFFEPARKLFKSCNFQPCAPFAHYKEDVNSLYFTKLISND